MRSQFPHPPLFRPQHPHVPTESPATVHLFVHRSDIRVYRRVFETMEKKIAEGTQKECFATEYLKIAEKGNFNENQKFFTGIHPLFLVSHSRILVLFPVM